MRTNPALCVQFDQSLTWVDEKPLRLPECLAAEKTLQETEERAEAWWWAAMEHAWEAITTEYSLQEWRKKKNPSFLRQHAAVLVKPDVS